jgi:hypothetical protein
MCRCTEQVAGSVQAQGPIATSPIILCFNIFLEYGNVPSHRTLQSSGLPRPLDWLICYRSLGRFKCFYIYSRRRRRRRRRRKRKRKRKRKRRREEEEVKKRRRKEEEK